MTKEESIVLWNLEKQTFEDNLDIYPRYKELIEIVDPLIKSGELYYDKFSMDIADRLMDVFQNDVDDSTLEDRRKNINTLIDILISQYKTTYGK